MNVNNEGTTIVIERLEAVSSQLRAQSDQNELSRRALTEDLRLVEARVDIKIESTNLLHEQRYKEMSEELAKSTALMKEVLEFFETLKGGLKVMGWLGVFAKWVAGIAVASVAIYNAYQKLTGKA